LVWDFHYLRVVVLSHPDHGITSGYAAQESEDRQGCLCPANATVAGDFDSFEGSPFISFMKCCNGLSSESWQGEILPLNPAVWPTIDRRGISQEVDPESRILPGGRCRE
jgi:hypothetical protein